MSKPSLSMLGSVEVSTLTTKHSMKPGRSFENRKETLYLPPVCTPSNLASLTMTPRSGCVPSKRVVSVVTPSGMVK